MAGLKVYRYELPELDSLLDGDFTIEVDMPAGAKIIHADYKHEVPNLWAIVDPSLPIETRILHCVGTGWGTVDPTWRHIATLKFLPYMWHLFEVDTVENLK